MTKKALIVLVISCIFAPAAHASAFGKAIFRAKSLELAAATCPAGVSVQMITVENEARVGTFALARVENAVVAQSLQLRAAWETPCVQFGPGGWPLSLRIGGVMWGVHYADPTRMVVYTGAATYEGWSSDFSHEVVETLVDPQTTTELMYQDRNWGALEVADPVYKRSYRLDGVWVTDFVTPAWYAGGMYGDCSASYDSSTATDVITCVGPKIAQDDAAGPYDEMGLLHAPWDLTWGVNEDAPAS